MTDTVSAEPLVVPPEGDTESQEEPLVTAAVYDTVGPAVDVTLNGCEDGLEPPAIPVKVKADGVGTVVTLKVTFTVRGLFVAPVAVSVMVPPLTPGGALVGSAETVIVVTPVVPVMGDTDSQPPVLDAEAVNGTCELGEVVTRRDCDGGEAEFTELKTNGGGATRPNGTVRFTVTVCDELEAEV